MERVALAFQEVRYMKGVQYWLPDFSEDGSALMKERKFWQSKKKKQHLCWHIPTVSDHQQAGGFILFLARVI